MFRPPEPFARLPIAYKLGLLLAGLVGAAFISLWFIIQSTLFSLLSDQIDTFGNTMANQTALSAAEFILADEMLSLKVIANQVSQAANIVHVRISNIAGETLADSGKQNETNDQYKLKPTEILYSDDIVFQGVKVGEASIVIDNSTITATIKRTLSWMTLAFVFALMFGIPLIFLLARSWSEPIHRLTDATLAINAGNLEIRMQNDRSDEFGVLIDSFNDMAASLKEREHLKDAVHRYIGSGVARQLLVTPENPVIPLQPLVATVAFFDIVSFTRLCEKLSSDRIAVLLNRYYACIQYCCTAFGGFVDKYIGDGALVVFSHTKKHQEKTHARNALLASHLFLRVAQRCIDLEGDGPLSDEPLAFRIGFHTGEMLAGTLGDAERLQYTVIGDAVNVAARLCEKAPPNTPVFSAASREKIRDLADKHVKFADRWMVRGRHEDVTVYATKRLPDTLQAQLQVHYNGIVEKILHPAVKPIQTIEQQPEDMAQSPECTPSTHITSTELLDQ